MEEEQIEISRDESGGPKLLTQNSYTRRLSELQKKQIIHYLKMN